MVFDGSTFQLGSGVAVPTAFEGDTALSPSTLLTAGAARRSQRQADRLRAASRRRDEGRRRLHGRRRRKWRASACAAPRRTSRSTSASSSRTTTSTASDAAEYGFAGADDPGFAPYLSKGASNVVLVDLATHKTIVVTHMNPGQYALYPHFRSDGWLYFLVRDTNNGGAEHLVASDLALRQ